MTFDVQFSEHTQKIESVFGDKIVVEDGFEKGKQAEYDRFWDAFQQNGNRTMYRYAFYSQGSQVWDDNLYNPKYPINATASDGAGSMFQASLITDTKVDVAIGANAQYTFLSCNNLVTIRKLIVTEATTVHAQSFGGCNNLENITIDGVIACNNFNFQWSTKLSRASIISIVSHLSTTTSGLSITLSKKAVNNAFTAEKWTALEQTRPNWTISLV